LRGLFGTLSPSLCSIRRRCDRAARQDLDFLFILDEGVTLAGGTYKSEWGFWGGAPSATLYSNVRRAIFLDGSGCLFAKVGEGDLKEKKGPCEGMDQRWFV